MNPSYRYSSRASSRGEGSARGRGFERSRSVFAALFRAVLILHGKQAPVAKPDCVRATAQLLRLDTEVFERIFAFRADADLPATETEANEIFAVYMDQIELVIEDVDKMDRGATGV
jgi:hypothetical protein